MAKKLPLPLPLIFLDIIGTLFIGVGLALMLTDAELLPAHLRFEHDGLIYIVIGGACMLPAVNYLVNLARKKQQSL
ncbi:MAG TPA: hypothetical protein VIC08_01525 [Cellvibrionaceae bacterium]